MSCNVRCHLEILVVVATLLTGREGPGKNKTAFNTSSGHFLLHASELHILTSRNIAGICRPFRKV